MYLYDMKRIETRDNEFIMQFRKSLGSSFPPALDLKVDYYLGEEQGVKGLYFTITSRFGLLFRKIMQLEPRHVIADVEEEFMNMLINDLVMNGVTFLNLMAFDSIDPRRVDKEVKAKEFINSAPRKLIYQN